MKRIQTHIQVLDYIHCVALHKTSFEKIKSQLPGQAFPHINTLTRLAWLPSLFMSMLILVVIVDISTQTFWWVLEMVQNDLGLRTQILRTLDLPLKFESNYTFCKLIYPGLILLKITLTMRNGHIYSSNKNSIEITFFHRWELHGKRNIDNSQEGMFRLSETIGPFIRAKISRGLNKPRLK
jgi:hypothetical protein